MSTSDSTGDFPPNGYWIQTTGTSNGEYQFPLDNGTGTVQVPSTTITPYPDPYVQGDYTTHDLKLIFDPDESPYVDPQEFAECEECKECPRSLECAAGVFSGKTFKVASNRREFKEGITLPCIEEGKMRLVEADIGVEFQSGFNRVSI